MPPFAAELEEWWLDSGYGALTRLLDENNNHVNPRQCGFAQHVQSRLLAFDNDRALQARIQEGWPAIRATRGIDYEANPRKNLREAVCTIFRRPEDGGINYARVMDGLGYLDAMEVHRLRLMEAAKVAVEAGSPEDHQLQLLEELHRTASANYRSSHAGFRTCVLMEDLTQDAERRRKRPQIMARVNALFPSTAFLEDEYDIDPTPYSASLLESLRFNIFEHLMAEDPFSQEKQQMIQMRLLCWSDIPGYPQAREALIRYFEESKKLEEVCWAVLDALERRPSSTISTHAPSPESSFANTSTSSHPSSISPRGERLEAITSTNTSFEARQSPLTSPISPSAPPVPNPLLKGTPGRELSAAKTDGAAFAGDFSAAPILCYPNDISRTEFYQHPLARDLDMTSLEKSVLGLLIPKELKSRDF